MTQESPSRAKRAALGRGLSALIPSRPAGPVPGQVAGLMRLPIEKLVPNPDQPRRLFNEVSLQELANSIKEHGIIQPIVVRRESPNSFSIVAGERRWRAAQRAGLAEIPAVISDSQEEDGLILALVENLQREDLNPIEEAEALLQLKEDLGITQEEIANRVGKDRATVANSMRLLKLPESVRQLLSQGDISMGHARALLGLSDASSMERVAREIVRKKLSVRDVERRVKLQRSGSGSTASAKKEPSAAMRDVTEKLIRSLSTKVVVKETGKGKGHIQIAYHSYDELDRLLAHIIH